MSAPKKGLEVPNTLALPSRADVGFECYSQADAGDALNYARAHELPLQVVGQGSNIIAAEHVDAAVVLMRMGGIEVIQELEAGVLVRVGAGEDWHHLVMHSIGQGWYGLENLALIPGTVGAAPVQNIGAYGAELAGFVHAVEVVTPQGVRRLSRTECGFGYRTSVFQRQPEWIITALELQLTQSPESVNLSYPEVAARLAHVSAPSPRDVAYAVIDIRQAKLPDPKTHPNCGSFFRNPVVAPDQAERLAAQNPDLVRYPAEGGVKLSAAQLIDTAGWKSRAGQRVRCWQRQPLILVNSGGASASDVLAFAEAIRTDIQRLFDVQLELEPSLLS